MSYLYFVLFESTHYKGRKDTCTFRSFENKINKRTGKNIVNTLENEGYHEVFIKNISLVNDDYDSDDYDSTEIMLF